MFELLFGIDFILPSNRSALEKAGEINKLDFTAIPNFNVEICRKLVSSVKLFFILPVIKVVAAEDVESVYVRGHSAVAGNFHVLIHFKSDMIAFTLISSYLCFAIRICIIICLNFFVVFIFFSSFSSGDRLTDEAILETLFSAEIAQAEYTL